MMAAVTVYCQPCRALHSFTALEVEQLIQALIGAWSDEATTDDGPDVGRAGWEVCAEFCPQDWLRQALDLECYGEHVASMRDCRLIRQAAIAVAARSR